jgi:hypothetical protein
MVAAVAPPGSLLRSRAIFAKAATWVGVIATPNPRRLGAPGLNMDLIAASLQFGDVLLQCGIVQIDNTALDRVIKMPREGVRFGGTLIVERPRFY